MTFKEITALCILMSFLCNGAAAVSSCEPDCVGLMDFDKVVDPRDCRRYYVCIDGKPTPNSIACNPGFYFDGTTCVLNIPPCDSVCGPDGGSGECHLTCDGTVPTDFINDPFDCSIYYECVPGGLKTKECPENMPYFDLSVSGCVQDESVCCAPGCIPHCQRVDTIIPDPLDCAYYYLCLDVGKPQLEYRMRCEEGQYFDLPVGKCSSTAECQVLCPSITTVPQPIVSTGKPVVTPTSGNCADDLQCESLGLFPKCKSCHPQYFRCTEVGKPAVEQSCEEGFLFNPVSSFPYCILSSVCPYYPFI